MATALLAACGGAVGSPSTTESSTTASAATRLPSAAPSAPTHPPAATANPLPTQPVVRYPGDWIAAEQGGRIKVFRFPHGTYAPFTSVPSGEQLHPDWSPDGKRLSFDILALTGEIWIGDVEGPGADLVVPCQAPCQWADEAAWSPDGKRLVFQRMSTSNGESVSTLEILDVASGDIRVVVTAPPARAFWQPRWAPDGHRVVTEYSAATASGAFHVALAIVNVDVDNPTIDEITKSAHLTNSPDWSWATNRIVFAQPSTADGFDGPSNLVTIDADGTDRQVVFLVGARGGQTPQPAWSSDGRRIIFVEADGAMLTVGVDGSDPRSVFLGEWKGMHPRYRPSSN